MKKIFLLATLFAAYHAQSQTLNVNSSSACGISLSVLASDPGTFNGAYHSVDIAVPAGTVASYSSGTGIYWDGATPPVSAIISGITVLDDGQLKRVGPIGSGYPSDLTLDNPCGANFVHLSWTSSGDGSGVIVIDDTTTR